MKSLALLAALVATPALAGTTSIFVSDSGGTILDSQSSSGQTAGAVTSGGEYAATADFGVLKSYVGGNAPVVLGPCCSFSSYTLGAEVSFTDVVTISAAPGVTSGSYTATLFLSGTLEPLASVSASGNVGFATMEASLELVDAATRPFDLSYTLSNYSGFIGSGGGSLNGDRYTGAYTGAFTFSIPYENLVGQTIKVSLKCGMNAINLQGGDAAGGICDLGHSLYWGGISNIVDQNGTPVAGASAMGGSGFNYLNASPLYVPPGGVPEPGNWALLIAGFGLTGMMQRHRRMATI
jgi:hypothetical protein